MTLDPSQTAPVNGGDSQASCPSLDDMVEQLASDAARGEFDKKAKDKLLEAAKGAAKALQDYKRDYDAHKARWVVQNGKIEDLGCRLSKCFPDWRSILETKICQLVIKPIRDTRRLLYYGPEPSQPNCPPPSCKNGPKVGFCETALVEKTYCLDQAKAQLEAWKDMTSWVKGRLDADQALYDEICKLDKCEEYAVALYIYHFELLPAHRSLGPNQPPRPKPAEDEYCKGTALPDCRLKGYPWLVTPESYLGHLNEVACLWRDAGRRHAEAQAAFDRIEDLKAKLKDDDTPKSRRTKATEVLKDLKCSDGGGGKDPGSPPRSDPDPYPAAAPRPDPGQAPTQQQTAR